MVTARRSWRFGGLTLDAESDDGRLAEALGHVLLGYAGAPAVAPRARLQVRLDLGGALTRDLPAIPRFVPASDGTLADRSEAWEATFSWEGTAATATARLRALRDEVAVRRAMVVGFLRVAAALAAPLGGGLLAHGCAMASPARDRAVLFMGASGEGKTTMARRLRGWRLLADDCAWVGRDATGGWQVGGTPFHGKEGLPRDGALIPLSRVVLLAPHAPALALTPVPPGEALRAMLARILWFAADPGLGQRLLDLVGGLAEEVPCLRLASGLHHDVASLFPTRAGQGD